MDVAALRREYTLAGLRRSDLDPDPIHQFQRWFDASAAVPVEVGGEPNAMTLATVGPEGAPSTRVVLLKGFDAEGFRFFTNYGSRKGREIGNNDHVSLNFHWHALERQVSIQGRAERASREVSRAYFDSRPRGSRLGAIASAQSEVVPDRAYLEERLRDAKARYDDGGEPALPDFWGGFVVRPTRYEFWQGRTNRLHDRFQYRSGEKDRAGWVIERLSS